LKYFLFSIVGILFMVLCAEAQVTPDSTWIAPSDSGRPIRQGPDSTLQARDSLPDDSNLARKTRLPVKFSDSVSRRPEVRALWNFEAAKPLSFQILEHHPYLPLAAPPEPVHAERRIVRGKETMFYVLSGLLLLFALLRQTFNKYFADLFRVFFRTTIKQRQIREQLMQSTLPSLCFNLFFIACTGLYIDLMLYYFKLVPERGGGLLPINNFWVLYVYCCLGLGLIYLGKFIGLKLVGWLFNMTKAADSYIFIVFIINKVIGIFLLPVLIALAFAREPLYSLALIVSWCGLGALLFYRFILGFAAIRNEVKLNLFHFFLYLCAFEITPLLLIYRLLLLVF
jgi:hypothetical protein